MTGREDERYIRLALKLAEKGKGYTSPNPAVGAVVVKDGRIVGKGYHRRAGAPHAEREALDDARENAAGGTLYVNLEPCCHFGRTGPCTDAIIRAGIKRVVFSFRDPNPKVNGFGEMILKKAGIKVKSGILADESKALNESYIKSITTGLPFLTLKMAQSLDGRIATAMGDSRWISGEKSLIFAHQLRAWADAVAVGAGAVAADNPQLTVRFVKGKNPYRIIISSHPKISSRFNLFAHNDDAKTILATSKSAARKISRRNLIVWQIKDSSRGLSLTDFLCKAGEFGIQDLLVEGGGRLATSFLRQKLVDKLHLVIAPIIIGRGREAVGELNIRKLIDAIKFDSAHFQASGEDILFTGYPARG
jgi:diaminohydroxyphosphoribosylaminopyrimidine deaminase/5-amino-6-(5-phosphoribosylamino)uracil reductase